MMTAAVMTLKDRLDMVAAREAEDITKGFIVFEIVKDLDFWAECGVTTAAEYDALMDAEFEREMRKADMAGDDDFDYQAAMERNERETREEIEREDEMAQRHDDLMVALNLGNLPPTPFYATCNHYQPGWN